MATPSNTTQKPATAKPPAGFDINTAKGLAPQVNSNLVSKGRDRYDRNLLKKFQTAAGIAVDGLYGGGARGALIFYGIANPPQPFFKPTATAPYPWTPYIANQLGVVPASKAAAPAASKPLASAPSKPAPVAASTLSTGKPPTGFDIAKAKTLAPQVNADLVAKGRDRYSHSLLKSFQIAAGIAADGLYGGGARGALIFYGIANPPQPFFKPTATAPYPWTAYIAKSLGKTPPPATKPPTSTAATVNKPGVTTTGTVIPPVKPTTGPSTKPVGAKPAQVITVTGPRVAPAEQEQTRPDPIATHEQVDEYEPITAPIAAAAASGRAPSLPSVPTPEQGDKGAGAEAGAAASASAPATSGGGGGAILALLAVAGGGWYYATRKKRKASSTYNY